MPGPERKEPEGSNSRYHHVESLLPASLEAEFATPTVCPACGVGIVEGAHFCAQCGRPITATIRPAHEGTTTILFTDVERFSRLLSAVGDEAGLSILRRHNEIVRTQVQKYGGFEVKAQGDGFMVAFTTARRAVLCAVDIQRGIAGYNSENPDRPLVLRMGLNAGDVLRDEQDFFGAAVNLASRIAEMAKGGQILTSELVKGLVGPASGFKFVPKGAHRLKGFPDRYKLYEVDWS